MNNKIEIVTLYSTTICRQQSKTRAGRQADTTLLIDFGSPEELSWGKGQKVCSDLTEASNHLKSTGGGSERLLRKQDFKSERERSFV